jgi:hypothetical protein
VLPAHDDQVPVADGYAGQGRAGIALGRPDGDGDVAWLAAGRSPERVTDQLRRRLTLLGPLEEHDYMRMRRVPVAAAAVPREAQCP